MRKTFLMMALLLTPQIAGAQPVVLASNAPMPSYTLETPIATLAANPAAVAVLNKDIPGLLSDKSYDLFKSMNLKTIASLSKGQLTDQMLSQTADDLKALH